MLHQGWFDRLNSQAKTKDCTKKNRVSLHLVMKRKLDGKGINHIFAPKALFAWAPAVQLHVRRQDIIRHSDGEQMTIRALAGDFSPSKKKMERAT